MTKHPLPALIVLSTLSILFFSCMTPAKYAGRFKANPAVVPADFNPSRHILLVSEMPRLNNPNQTNKAVTRKLDEELKEYFPYKYEIVPMKDILDIDKYTDTSIYKYGIVNYLTSTMHTTTTTTTTRSSTGKSTMQVSPSARTTKIDFGFYDRLSGKRYNASGAGSANIKFVIPAFAGIIQKTIKR